MNNAETILAALDRHLTARVELTQERGHIFTRHNILGKKGEGE